MLPLYKRGVRYAWVPYRRLRRGAVFGGVAALLLLFLLFSRLSPEAPPVAIQQSSDIVQTRPVDVPADGGVDMDAEAEMSAAAATADPKLAPETSTQAPLVLRLLLPLVTGFCFGFLGSVPIAGPTSAMVLKLGIQGKYTAGLMIAVGGAISEAVGERRRTLEETLL